MGNPQPIHYQLLTHRPIHYRPLATSSLSTSSFHLPYLLHIESIIFLSDMLDINVDSRLCYVKGTVDLFSSSRSSLHLPCLTSMTTILNNLLEFDWLIFIVHLICCKAHFLPQEFSKTSYFSLCTQLQGSARFFPLTSTQFSFLS